MSEQNLDSRLKIPDSSSSDEISLKELILKIGEWYRYLKTQWWKIAIAGIIGGVIGFVYAWMQPVTYTAKTTFVVEDAKSSGGGLSGLASLAGQFGMDVSGGAGTGVLNGDNILLYFKSESLAREVLLNRYDSSSVKTIGDIYAEVYKLKEDWQKNPQIGKINFSSIGQGMNNRLYDSLLKKIVHKINNSQFFISKTDKKSSFIDVSTVMENEDLAKKYCDVIVKIAIERFIKSKIQRQKTTVEKLQARADSIAQLLGKKTIASAALQTSTNTMDVNPLYKTKSNVAAEVNSRDKAILNTIFASVIQNLEMAKLTLSQETPIIQIVDQSYLPLQIDKKPKLLTSFVVGFFFILFFSFLFLVRFFIKQILVP